MDELTSLGVSPGESFAANRSTLWSHEFVPTASPVVVEREEEEAEDWGMEGAR